MIRKRFISIIVMASIAILCIAGTVFAEDGMTLLFSEDFSEDKVGEFPDSFVVSGRKEYVRVVEDSTAVGGKALIIMGDPQTRETRVDGELPQALTNPILIFEFSLRVEDSGGANFYFSEGPATADIFVILSPANGALRYNLKNDIAPLNNGWNRIKLVVELGRSRAYIYVNNMDSPVFGPAPFYKDKQSATREDLFFRYQLSAGPGREHLKGKIYIDDIKIKIAESTT